MGFAEDREKAIAQAEMDAAKAKLRVLSMRSSSCAVAECPGREFGNGICPMGYAGSCGGR